MKAVKFDPVELLRLMGATRNEQECEKALRIIFETARSVDHHAIQDLSDPEIRSFCTNVDKSMIQLHDSSVVFDECQLFFTRVACSTAKDSTDLTFGQKEEILAKTTPDIPTLCDVFQKHLLRLIEAIQEEDQESEDQESFVCLQLLKLAEVAGPVQEEGSRRHVASVITQVLSSTETPEDLVDECLQTLYAAHDADFDYYETISTIVFNLSTDEECEGGGDGEDAATQRDVRVLLIFTFVLENAPSNLSSHQLLDAMGKVILTSITTNNSRVREIGISCVGRLGLFSQEPTVLSEFKPVLLRVAENKDEALQCRGQALLALADWALLHPEILHPIQRTGGQGTLMNFVSIVQELMTHENQTLAAIAAEVAAKLLFSGRSCESQLLAQLLVLFFDPIQENISDNEVNDVNQVGSPVRLQQLLCLFFPSFCLQSTASRHAFLWSIGTAFDLGLNNRSSHSRRGIGMFPFVKMAEYVCAVTAESEASVTVTTPRGDSGQKEASTINVELSVSLQIAQFLVKNESKLTSTQLRSICKLLGGYEIEAQEQDRLALAKLKDSLDEIETFLTDASALRSLETLIEFLAAVKGTEDVDDSETQDSEDQDNDVTSDDETVSEQSFYDDENRNESVDDSTVADTIMDSLAKLSVNKENPPAGKTVPRTRRSSQQSIASASSISVLENLGSPIP
jgi:condensin complex subunit 3